MATTKPNASAGPLSASRKAAIAGPAKTPTLSNVLDETFAAVSSSGERASSGVSDASAGRKTVPSTVVQVATAYSASEGPPDAASTVVMATVTIRARSDPSMTRSRGYLSDRLAAKGAITAAMTCRTAVTTPTAVAPPCS